jgi:hypothetical protein
MRELLAKKRTLRIELLKDPLAYAGGSDASSVLPQRGQTRVLRVESVHFARAVFDSLVSPSPSRSNRERPELSGRLTASASQYMHTQPNPSL